MDKNTIDLLCEKGFIPQTYRDQAVADIANADETREVELSARREEIAALMRS